MSIFYITIFLFGTTIVLGSLITVLRMFATKRIKQHVYYQKLMGLLELLFAGFAIAFLIRILLNIFALVWLIV